MRIAGAAKNEPQIQKTSAAAGVQVAIDPVCGMEVKKDADAIRTKYRGKTYWFCSKSCREDFEAAPQKHLSGSAAAPRSIHAGPA
jgi:Cu+-exporting ATPase